MQNSNVKIFIINIVNLNKIINFDKILIIFIYFYSYIFIYLQYDIFFYILYGIVYKLVKYKINVRNKVLIFYLEINWMILINWNILFYCQFNIR